ncbi:hypothetical protein IU486_28120 [Streptomyces gardneri]|uniref:hypothetical protein n=1 Tax=Nocardia sputi TaxID=2943705 RepID=UPI0018934922|nr:hypothetical protein [Nocardia sputi]MBF6168588.1 hypothetical protein [Streptomyces gardneri]UAK31405.1 hypothetical protein K8O92_26975 [Nocardia asteroides]
MSGFRLVLVQCAGVDFALGKGADQLAAVDGVCRPVFECGFLAFLQVVSGR